MTAQEAVAIARRCYPKAKKCLVLDAGTDNGKPLPAMILIEGRTRRTDRDFSAASLIGCVNRMLGDHKIPANVRKEINAQLRKLAE